MSFRPITDKKLAQNALEGAGVSLYRAFGFRDPEECNPFLMLDDFRNDDPQKFKAGFPWHPHRGIETITYVLKGSVEHQDSLGNNGLLSDGDVQWMTAGSGIMHQEMPLGNKAGSMHGFQLWANLPGHKKMVNPRYQDVKSNDIPLLEDDDGSKIKVVVGDYKGIIGPVEGIAAEPQYFDIYVPPNTIKKIKIDAYKNCFAYVFEGEADFAYASNPVGIRIEKEYNGKEVNIRDLSGNRTLIRFDTGDHISLKTGENGVRFLLVSGKPIKEPVAWHGPIVMNTREELAEAFSDLRNGTFIKTLD
jgi:hypothetical protein